MQEQERWLPIVWTNGTHEVSDQGQVRSVDRAGADGRRLKGRLMHPSNGTNGYRMLSIFVNKKTVTRTVHSIVAEAFIGPRPKGYEVNHKDGNKRNNAAANLEYVTPSQNHVHAIRLGLRKSLKGTDAPRARLSEAQVHEIRSQAGKRTTRQLAADYGIGKSTVQQILAGKIWRHLNDAG